MLLSILQEIIMTLTHHEVVEYTEQCTQEISSWVEAVNDLMQKKDLKFTHKIVELSLEIPNVCLNCGIHVKCF